ARAASTTAEDKNPVPPSATTLIAPIPSSGCSSPSGRRLPARPTILDRPAPSSGPRSPAAVLRDEAPQRPALRLVHRDVGRGLVGTVAGRAPREDRAARVRGRGGRAAPRGDGGAPRRLPGGDACVEAHHPAVGSCAWRLQEAGGLDVPDLDARTARHCRD